MKLGIALSIATLTAAHLAHRQTTTTCTATAAIPTCAIPCITSAASAIGCSTEDYACQCASSRELQSSAGDCVLSGCGTITVFEVISAAEAVCAVCV